MHHRPRRRTSPACASAPERQVGRLLFRLPRCSAPLALPYEPTSYVKPPHKYNGQFLRSGVRRASYDTPGTPTRPLEAQDLTL
jgi:hypothetical protein